MELVLCYSIAEYAALVWARSKYADILDQELNKACWTITWCLKPTFVEYFNLSAGIAPPDIKRDVCTRMERNKQMEQQIRSLFTHIPARSLKSRKDLLINVKPSYFPAKVVRCNEWQRRSRDKSPLSMVILNEELARGYDSPWLTWQCLNRIQTGYTCSKKQRKKWGYFNGDITCACGLDAENTAHMLQCSLLTHPCTMDDLLKFNNIGYKFTVQWKRKAWWHDDDDLIKCRLTIGQLCLKSVVHIIYTYGNRDIYFGDSIVFPVLLYGDSPGLYHYLLDLVVSKESG